MPKNIVILLDGTSNEISQDRTNILRLFGCLTKSDKQIVFYDPGVGTFGAENSTFPLKRKTAEVWGLATGWGLDHNVKEAYKFIVEQYDHGNKSASSKRESDKIIIYGFSRGAYTARVLAGFIHAVGLIHPNHMNLLDYAYRAYKSISESQDTLEDQVDSNAFAEVRLYERALKPVRPSIAFLGLFDTVASVLEWGKVGVRLRSHAFTEHNRSVATVRHAVAIDETRTMFQPKLWPDGQTHRAQFWNAKSDVPQDCSEVWFKGSHGDIGGGYPEAKSALAKIPLLWMIEESKNSGVLFTTSTVNQIVKGHKRAGSSKTYTKPDPCDNINNSMTRGWKILEYVPRRLSKHIRTNRAVVGGLFVPRSERRIIPEGAQVHPSVFECKESDIAQLHPNLPDSNFA